MKTDALFTTQDHDVLRHIALALREENQSLTQRISEMQAALALARQARFGRKGEAFTDEQKTLTEEDVAADRADITHQLRDLLPEHDTPKEKPIRRELPADLPRETLVLHPESTTVCPDCGVTC